LIKIEKGSSEEKALVSYKIGRLYEKINDYNKAIKCFEDEINIKKNDPISIAYTYNSIGSSNYSKCLYKESIQFYLQAVEIFKSQNQEDNLAVVYCNIGVSYLMEKDYDKSMKYFNDSIALKRKNGLYSGDSMHYIALIHLKKKELEIAITKLEGALNEGIKYFGDKSPKIINIYKDMEVIYKELKNIDKSNDYKNKVEEILKIY